MDFVFLTLLFSTIVSVSSLAEQPTYSTVTPLNENVDCFSDSFEGTSWNYCISKTIGSTNPDIMFEFHGLSGSEHDWTENERGIAIRQAWKDLNIQAPTVVSVSFGPIWLLAEKNSSQYSGLFELFRDTVYSNILKKLSAERSGIFLGQKILMGASMGGFNASQIYLKNPSTFDKYVLACPIITDISPYSSQEEIDRYQQENNAAPWRVLAMLKISRTYYPDAASFDKAWALKMAPNLLGPLSPSLNISCGDQDQYGIFKSVEKFRDIALANGVYVQWKQIVNGKHCSIDPVDIAKYVGTH